MNLLLFIALLFGQSADDVFSRLLPATEAKQVREAITRTADQSPFAVETVQIATLKLVNAKVPAKDIPVILERSADAACGVQLEHSARAFAFLQIVGGFAEIYRDTSISGRIGARQMEGIGVPIAQLIARSTNQSEDFIEAAISRGRLSGPGFAEIILDCLKDEYSGLAAKAKK